MYIVLDTCVLIRSLSDDSPYSHVRKDILRICDVVASSKETLKECAGRVREGGMTPVIFQRKIKEIADLGKFRVVPKSRVQLQKVKKGTDDKYDEKFIRVALASKAGCIISTDTKLLQLDPYDTGVAKIRVLRPEQYPYQLHQP